MRYATKHGHYELNSFPGNSQIVVSNHAYVKEGYRGQGEGSKDHEARLLEMRRLGYDYAICTVSKDNVAEAAILIKNGWKSLSCFYAHDTGHDVEIWGKLLYQLPDVDDQIDDAPTGA